MPLETIEGMMKNLSQYQFDFILFTGTEHSSNSLSMFSVGTLFEKYFFVNVGDIPAHNVWNQSTTDQTEAIETWTSLFKTHFPGTFAFENVLNLS